MFDEFLGLPAHPLLVHAAVVFVPLLAVVAIAYAFVPVVRPHARWVLGSLAVVAPVAALLAKLSGDAFLASLDARGGITEGFYATLEAHQRLGNLTLVTTVVMAVVAGALGWLVPPRPPTAEEAGSRRVLARALGAVSVAAAAASVYFVVRTGDSGAQAVWGG